MFDHEREAFQGKEWSLYFDQYHRLNIEAGNGVVSLQINCDPSEMKKLAMWLRMESQRIEKEGSVAMACVLTAVAVDKEK